MNIPLATQRQEKVDKFIHSHNWQTVFALWQKRISNQTISLEPLFTCVPVHDPAMLQDRPTTFSWWPRKPTHYAKQKEIQRYLDNFPGTQGPLHWYEHTRKGEIDTLNYLWSVHDDLEKVAAVLIAASLFTRLRSSRYRYPRDTWPSISCVQVLEIWAYKAWQGNDYYAGWHNSCTQVLPELNEDYTCELNSLEDVIYYLADEHTTVLTNFAPVAIEFVPEHDPAIEAELSAEYAEEHRKSEELRKEFEELRTRQEQEEALRRQQHPRSDDWQALSAEELQRLVWTKSILQLSEEFGKSDVAIKKRCKKLGISTPPRGFWAKVYNGKIPHPNGVPVDDA
ncbi:hypothetical protein KFU94_41605 [Chloroflexi bacterium TSY]|nr:hypothetical protein [Chloroflexi bacterium TSY]